ncbi:MAG: arginine--tRNA ligase [Microthrixaceae bacterium]
MIRTELADALRAQLAAAGVDVEGDIHLEEPARREHGDWSSNVAMANAKRLGRNPRELAQQIVDGLNADLPTHVERAEIAGPGFVNFHLRPTWLHAVLRSVVAAGVDRYAQLDVGTGTKVMVEFVSANPTGPLHAGHARGAVYGDALARLLGRAGYEVAREFYINDRGGQMLKMGASMLARATGEPVPEGGYAGSYIAEWATQLPAEVVAQGDVEAATAVGYAAALADQREVLGALGVVFDVWFSEMSLVNHGAIEQTLDDLRARGVVDDRDGAVWLRSTDYGDDKDRVLVKSDGSYTYLLPDIAYHPRQVRPWLRPAHQRVGCRPPRLHRPHEGSGAGARPRAGSGRHRDHPAGEAAQGRPGGEALQAHRRLHRAARCHRRGRRRCDPPRLPAAVDRLTADGRSRCDRGAVDGQPGLLHPDGARPAVLDRPAGNRAGGDACGAR